MDEVDKEEKSLLFNRGQRVTSYKKKSYRGDEIPFTRSS